MYQYQPLDAELVGPILARNSGNVTLTAMELGVDSARLRAYVRAKSELLAVQTESKEQLLDQAESVVKRALECDEPRMRDRAAKFVIDSIGTGREVGHKYSNVVGIRTREPVLIVWANEEPTGVGTHVRTTE